VNEVLMKLITILYGTSTTEMLPFRAVEKQFAANNKSSFLPYDDREGPPFL
jgi:hypothetical protein